MTVTRHLSLNIKGCIRNNKDLSGLFNDEEGNLLSHNEALLYLNDCIAEGKRVLPMGKCDLFDYQTGCPGHPQPE